MQNSELCEVIARLRRQASDDALVEVKASGGGLGKSVWESVSSFANTAGGTLILGLDENTGFIPAPGFDPQRVLDQFVDGMGDGGSPGKLLNPPRYAIQRAEVDGAPIAVIEIEENTVSQKPCTVSALGIRSGSYKRVDDKDIRMSLTEIHELQSALLPAQDDRTAVEGTSPEDLDPARVQSLLKRAVATRALKATSTEEEQLRRLRVLTLNDRLTLSGLLTLGSYPQQFFPWLVVSVMTYPSPRRILSKGTLSEVVSGAVSEIRGTPIPAEVLREAITNTVLHREYHPYFLDKPITVEVFPDRITIANPGGLWGGKTLANLSDGESLCRNSSLLRLLQYEGVVSLAKQGNGIKRILKGMRKTGLEPPRFQASPAQVRVSFRTRQIDPEGR